MSTDFYSKKHCLYIVYTLICCIIFGFLSCAVYFAKREVLTFNKTFYFLISKTEHVEVGIYETQLDGGAGYLLNHEGEEYVAVAVYLTEEVGKAVQASMNETLLLSISTEDLYLFNRKQRSRAQDYKAAMDCLYHCIEILSKEIARLDKGATQQSSMKMLRILQKQFAYLSKEYENRFSAFSMACGMVSERMEQLLSDIIYARDLREIMCYACDWYIQLAKSLV